MRRLVLPAAPPLSVILMAVVLVGCGASAQTSQTTAEQSTTTIAASTGSSVILTTTTSSEVTTTSTTTATDTGASAEEAGLREALGKELNGATFEILKYMVSTDWAGAIVTPVGWEAEDAAYLLRKAGSTWRVWSVASTEVSVDEWLSLGAPEDIAKFLGVG